MARNAETQSSTRTAPSAAVAAVSEAPVETVRIRVTGDGRQARYGLAFRGKEFLYTADRDGVVEVPAGREAEYFLAWVIGAEVIA